MPSKFDPSTGGIIFIPQEKDNEVIIKTKEDFVFPIDKTKVYFVDKFIDMGSVELPIEDMYINGHGYGISGLFSSEDNYTMFKNATGLNAGNFIANGVTFYVTGTNSKIFDLDNNNTNGAFELNSVNLGDFPVLTTSLGSISNYRQVRTGDFAAIRYAEGLTFNGTFSGLAFNDSILLSNQASTTFLKEGTALSVTGGLTSDMNAFSLDDTSTWCDFNTSVFVNDQAFAPEGLRLNRDSDPIPNIDLNSTKTYIKNCVGITNTQVRALITSTTEVVNTLDTDTPEKVEGDTTTNYATWMSSPVSNRITIDTEVEMDVEVFYKCRIDAGANDEIAIAINQYDSSDTLINQIVREVRNVSNVLGGLDIVDFDIDGLVSNTNQGDYFEPTIENTTDSTDATVLIGAKLKVVRI